MSRPTFLKGMTIMNLPTEVVDRVVIEDPSSQLTSRITMCEVATMNSIPLRLPTPEEQLMGMPGLDNVQLPKLLDFWKWAFSDLSVDHLKGIFAEWMVGVLLGLSLEKKHRIDFANSDHFLPDGRGIEVKATAYWQSWRMIDEKGKPLSKPFDPTPLSKIRFRGLLAHKSSGTSNAVGDRVYKSDIYVFCFQKEKNPIRWNALDLSQWEFYVARKEDLQKLGTHSISLAHAAKICPAMTAVEFQQKMRKEYGVPAQEGK